jgi:predicted protein tyrosine phosphatase
MVVIRISLTYHPSIAGTILYWKEGAPALLHFSNKRITMFTIKITELDLAEIILEGNYPSFYPTRTLSLVDDSEYMNENFKPVNSSHLVLYVDDITTPRQGYTLPETKHVELGLKHFENLNDNDRVLIHCHAGVSRSTAMAVLLLVKYGMSPEEAILHIEDVRDCLWPNEYIIEIGDKLLDCDGRLISAVQNWKDAKRGVFFSRASITP